MLLTLSTGASRPRLEPTGTELRDVEATAGLTRRQFAVLALVADGCTNKEIAQRLGITSKTVMHHLTIVYQVLGVRTRTEAALWAIANGIGD